MEKFGLLNLLKAIETLSPPASDNQTDTEKQVAPPPLRNATTEVTPVHGDAMVPNVMASVIERHEMISNRIKNNRR